MTIALAIFGVAVLGAVTTPWVLYSLSRSKRFGAELESAMLRGNADTMEREIDDLADDIKRQKEVIDDLNERRREALVAARRCSEPGSALDSLLLLLGEDTSDSEPTEISGELLETSTPTPTWADPDDTV